MIFFGALSFSQSAQTRFSESGSLPLANGNGSEPAEGSYSHYETSSEVSDVSTIEQRRAYKLELHDGKSLFNRKPKKGIDFLINAKKVGDSAEEIAAFLKSASGLNKFLNSNRMLGMDGILNIVIRKRGEENMETSGDLIKHMQEQFKEKAHKSELIAACIGRTAIG